MKFLTRLVTLIVFTVAPIGTAAQEPTPVDVNDVPLVTAADSLDPFLWVARPVIVFADSPNDPRFIEQLELLNERKMALFERDVVVITDTDTANPSEIRRKFRPRGFSLVLVGKDGQIVLRKPAPWDVRELTRSIDKIPLRQQEIRDANTAGAG
jgi:hypothetical protein